MKRSLFDGNRPGGRDPAIVLQLLNAAFYIYYSRQRNQPALDHFRPFLGFVLFCSLFTGLGLVHSIKWVLGRARPYLVLEKPYLVLGKGLPFTNWYEFGPQFVTDGIFYGSFPSGHTATVFLTVTIAYWLIATPNRSTKARTAGWIWGALAMIYSAMMIAGRCITLDHWITDCVGSVLLSWIFIHLTFFHILKIPAQVRYLESHGSYAPVPRYWEISLLWRLLLVTIGLMSIIIGIRSILDQRATWLIVIVVPGIFLVHRFVKSLIRTYRESMVHFQPFAD